MVADLRGLLLNGPEKKRQYISVLTTALFNTLRTGDAELRF